MSLPTLPRGTGEDGVALGELSTAGHTLCSWNGGKKRKNLLFMRGLEVKSKTKTFMFQLCWFGHFHPARKSGFPLSMEVTKDRNKYWELTVFLLRKFFLFQGHFLNYTNLSNVSSVLQEVSFSAFVKRKIIASGKQQNEKNLNYAL